jgi:hypothetical protein
MTSGLKVLDDTLTDLLDRAERAPRVIGLMPGDRAIPRLEQFADDLDTQIARYVRHHFLLEADKFSARGSGNNLADCHGIADDAADVSLSLPYRYTKGCL